MNEVLIVKIGGHVIDNTSLLQDFLADFSRLDVPKILVHGGGKIATQIGHQLNIQPQYVDGRRITDEDTLKLITMVYAGGINKDIVSRLQSLGCNTIGLTGADGGLMKAVKRPVAAIDYGFVGDLHQQSVNNKWLSELISAGLSLVIAPLTWSETDGLLNTNADTIAQAIATSFPEHVLVKLVYVFEKDGVLDQDGRVIPKLNKESITRLTAEGTIHDGMIPKLKNATDAIDHGVRQVLIGNSLQLSGLLQGSCGTTIQ